MNKIKNTEITNENFNKFLNEYISFFNAIHSISIKYPSTNLNDNFTIKILWDKSFIKHSLGLQNCKNGKCTKLKNELLKENPNISFFKVKENLIEYYKKKKDPKSLNYFYAKFNSLKRFIISYKKTKKVNTNYVKKLFNVYLNTSNIGQKDDYFKNKNVFKNADYCFFNNYFGLCTVKYDKNYYNNPYTNKAKKLI